MQLTDTLSTLLRRWYLVIAGLVLTAALGWTAYQTVPERYEARGSILLMPAESVVGTDGNPYLFLSGMNDALDVLVRRTNSTEMGEQILADSDGATYSADRDATTQSPIIVFSIEADTNAEALRLLGASMTAAEWNLDTMQEELSISEERRITARDLVIDEEATKDTKTPLQMSVVVVGAGLVGTLMMTGMIDGYLVRRNLGAQGNRQTSSVAVTAQSPPAAKADSAEKRLDTSAWSEHGRGAGAFSAPAELDDQHDRDSLLESHRR